MDFVNRKKELELLTESFKKNGLVVLFGRRRIGKSQLVDHWLEKSKHRGCRTQCIQGTTESQIKSIYEDVKEFLEIQIEPTSWNELFQLIDGIKGSFTLAIDEFPYLAETDRSVQSIFQKWIDIKKKKDLHLILLGSSQHMMNDVFLNKTSPLFGRAYREIKLEGMRLKHFCEATKMDPCQKSFDLYALVGGIPKYWDYIDPKSSVEQNIDRLFFDYAAFLDNEPLKLLKDEAIEGLIPLSILDCIGRGTHKPSEIAARMGVPQSNLSRSFSALLNGNFLKKDICFGENLKNPKKILYQIQDYAFCFWYQVYTPYQTRWSRMHPDEKKHVLQLYFSKIFEDYIRSKFSGAQRYWEVIKTKNKEGAVVTEGIEFDSLYFEENDPQQLVVTEVKYKKLTNHQRQHALFDLQKKWERSKISRFHTNPEFKIIDLEDIEDLQ